LQRTYGKKHGGRERQAFENISVQSLQPDFFDVLSEGTKRLLHERKVQMASKRGIRKRNERIVRQKLEQESNMAENKLTGNVGRTSVADLILARTRFLHPDKPSIQVVQPQPAAPLEKPGDKPVAASPALQDTAPVAVDPIISSVRHKEMIFREADENRDHYLLKQLEDGEKLPWFRYVRKESQYSEFVMLTTEMAKAMLQSVWTETEGNRKLKVWLKDAYKRDIDNDRWIPSDESIGIDFNGVVYNGRHRLTALVESGKEWPFYVTFNCLEEAKFTVDSGAKRNSAEKLRLVIDTKLGNRTTGFCKAIMKGLQSKVRYTETEIAEFAHKWQDLIAWISSNLPVARAEVQAAIAKAYLWYGPEKIELFAERLREVKFTEDGDPARALYLALTKAKINRINVASVAYKKTLASVEATVTNKPLSRLYERDEDIFQWQEGWELPQGSWWEAQPKE